MTTNRIEEHIDKKIYQALSDGETYQFVISDLKDGIERFTKRSGFVNVSKRYLINNWTRIQVKKRYTTYYVMHTTKRLHDIEWIVKNQCKFPELSRSKMFNLIKLKDKLRFDIS